MISESAEWRLNVHCWSPISFRYATLQNVDWAGPKGKCTIWTFELSCLGPVLDPKPCSPACWPCSISIQQNGAWKGIGGVIVEMLVSVPQVATTTLPSTMQQPWLHKWLMQHCLRPLTQTLIWFGTAKTPSKLYKGVVPQHWNLACIKFNLSWY